MAIVWPATTTDPARAAEAAAMSNVAAPLPVTDPADVSTTHDDTLRAVHPQVGAVVTVTVSAPPDAWVVCAAGTTEKVQLAGCCETLNRSPAAVIVAERACPVVEATSNW